MSKAGREAAEMVIAKALLDRLPDTIAPKNCANYILNQLMKAGFTNDKILVHVDEVRDELDQAVFKCRTDPDDLRSLIPQKIVLSAKDASIFADALENSKGGNQRLKDAMAKLRPVVHYLKSADGPLGEVACGDERAGEAISMSEEDATCPDCKTWLNTPTNPRSKG